MLKSFNTSEFKEGVLPSSLPSSNMKFNDSLFIFIINMSTLECGLDVYSWGQNNNFTLGHGDEKREIYQKLSTSLLG